MHREETERSVEGKLIFDSAERTDEQSKEGTVGRTAENAEQRECRRGEENMSA